MTHAEALELLTRTRPEGAGPRAVRLVQTVAWHETNYGQGWLRSCPAMVGSHNWGAIQGSPGEMCGDTHEDGSRYVARYRRYADDEAGAVDLWRELWRRPAVRRVLMDDRLDVDSLARAMKATKYFEAPVSRYIWALRGALATITKRG